TAPWVSAASGASRRDLQGARRSRYSCRWSASPPWSRRSPPDRTTGALRGLGALSGEVTQQRGQPEIVARLVEEGLDPERLRFAPVFGQAEVSENDDLWAPFRAFADQRAQHSESRACAQV